MGFKKYSLIKLYGTKGQTSVSHEGEEVAVDKDGAIEVPLHLKDVFISHGFSETKPEKKK